MIIANIHRRSYNSLVCSLQKSWLHQTGAPGLVHTTTTLLLMFGLRFVSADVWRRATGSKKKVARARECGKCDEHVWKFHFNAGKQPTGTTRTNTHIYTRVASICACHSAAVTASRGIPIVRGLQAIHTCFALHLLSELKMCRFVCLFLSFIVCCYACVCVWFRFFSAQFRSSKWGANVCSNTYSELYNLLCTLYTQSVCVIAGNLNNSTIFSCSRECTRKSAITAFHSLTLPITNFCE